MDKDIAKMRSTLGIEERWRFGEPETQQLRVEYDTQAILNQIRNRIDSARAYSDVALGVRLYREISIECRRIELELGTALLKD